MESLNSKSKSYQVIVQSLLSGYAQNKPAYGDIEVQKIFDTERNHYQILHLGWHHKRWVHHCVMHLDIRDDKVWIFHNSTEHDLVNDLEVSGVPKQDIVLGFCPPMIRAISDYAVN